MLKDRNSSAIVAVRDLERAKIFYRDTLGLTQDDSDPESGVLVFRTGVTQLTVYRSDYAGSNKANAVTWAMQGDLVETVEALKAKGVVFEHYADLPGLTLKGDIHQAGPVKLVWLKDPDGNILHLIDGL